MKCVWCAEQIQDDARLCRFCGARLLEGTWQAPDGKRSRRSLTLLSSGWLLAISGAWSFVTITSPVPLFGAVRTGVTAVVYNALIGAAFLSMGLGLARKTSWALKATMFATVVYSLDKLLFMVDGGARRAAFSSEGGAAALLGPELVNMVDPLLVVFSAVFLLGWWGLALFVYLRRKDFPVAG